MIPGLRATSSSQQKEPADLELWALLSYHWHRRDIYFDSLVSGAGHSLSGALQNERRGGSLRMHRLTKVLAAADPLALFQPRMQRYPSVPDSRAAAKRPGAHFTLAHHLVTARCLMCRLSLVALSNPGSVPSIGKD
jgi:hypothetical protein